MQIISPNVVYLSKGKSEIVCHTAEINGEGIFIEFNRDVKRNGWIYTNNKEF